MSFYVSGPSDEKDKMWFWNGTGKNTLLRGWHVIGSIISQ